MSPRPRHLRRGIAALVVALAAAIPLAAAAAPPVYALDPQRSFVHFEVLHFGVSTLHGRFGPIAGAVEFDRAARRGYVGLSIDVARLDTGLPVLDRRLRESDLFDTERHPLAWFVAERFHFDGDRLAALHGALTLRGITAPLALTVERFGCRPDEARGGERCGGDLHGEIRRSDFGMHFGLPFVGDTVRLMVQVEGWRP